MARKYAWLFVRGHYLFREANSFPRALEENCELRGTDNVQGQISEHIFKAKWGLLCLLSFIYFSQRAFGEYHRILPSSSWGISSHMMCLNHSRANENLWWIIIGDIFQMRVAKNIWRIINTTASIWLQKYARIFVLGHYQFLGAHSFLRANCSLLGTDNVHGQISEHIFEAKWRLLFNEWYLKRGYTKLSDICVRKRPTITHLVEHWHGSSSICAL